MTHRWLVPILALIVGACAVRTTGDPAPVSGGTTSCRQSSANDTIRKVQRSEDFRVAMRRVGHIAWNGGGALPDNEVQRLCDELKVSVSDLLPGRAFVSVFAYSDPSFVPVIFGIRRKQVTLLNAARNDVLLRTLDLDSWNKFVGGSQPVRISSRKAAISYGCIIVIAERGQFPYTNCLDYPPLRVDSSASGWQVDYDDYVLSFGGDGQVLNVQWTAVKPMAN